MNACYAQLLREIPAFEKRMRHQSCWTDLFLKKKQCRRRVILNIMEIFRRFVDTLKTLKKLKMSKKTKKNYARHQVYD